MNKNAFYALHMRGNGYARFRRKIPENGCFTLSVRCLTDCADTSGTLFALSELLAVGLSGEELWLEAGRQKRSVRVPVPSGCFNTVTLTCNNEQARLYCNDILCMEQACQIPRSGGDTLTLGENLRGCIQMVRLCRKCLTMEEIRDRLLNKAEDAEWQVDFDGSNLPEDAELCNCGVEKLVYTLDCRRGTFLAGTIRPLPEFTILCTLYPASNRFARKGITLLRLGDDLTLELCDPDGDNRFRPSIRINNYTYSSFLAIPVNQWSDIAVSIKAQGSQSKMELYVNGEKEIKDVSCPAVGDQVIQFGSFEGYVDCCALFGAVLAGERIEAYRKDAPGVFDKDLLRLYSFSDHSWRERCTGRLLKAREEAGYVLVSGTQAGLSAHGPGGTGPQEIRKYSEFAKWQIYFLLRILVEWVVKVRGIRPNRGVRFDGDKLEADEELYAFVYRDIAGLSEAQRLMSSYAHPNPEDFRKLIQKMMENGSMAKLLQYLYQEDDQHFSAAPSLLAILAAALAAAGTLLAQWFADAAAAALAAAASAVPKPPKPDGGSDDDDEDKKKDKTYLHIRQAVLKGELDIRRDAVSDDDSRHVSVFILSGSQPAKLTVEIECIGKGGQYTVKAVQNGNGILQPVEQTLSFSSGKTQSITLDIHLNRKDKRYGQYEDTLSWTAEGEDDARYLGDTEHKIHFLENAPVQPWNSSSIAPECLRFSAECAKKAGDSSQGFLLDYLHWLRQYTASEAERRAGLATDGGVGKTYWRMPTAHPPKAACFDAERFLEDFRQNKNIGADDLVISADIFSRLHGYETKTVFLYSGIEYLLEKEGGFQYETCELIRKESAGEDTERKHHTVVMYDGKVYDFTLNSYELPFAQSMDLPFTEYGNKDYYRESCYAPGTYCRMLTSIENWRMEPCAEEREAAAPVSHSDVEVWAAAGVHGIDGDLPVSWTVDPRIRINFNLNVGKDLCHSISCRTIDGTLNGLLQGNPGDAQDVNIIRGRLLSLIHALYPTTPLPNTWQRIWYDNALCLMESLVLRLRRHLRLANIHRQLSYAFKNAPGNLRVGNSQWNRRVGVFFDPVKWFHMIRHVDGLVADSDQEAFDNLSVNLPTGLPQPVYEGYYLCDRDDGIRIENLILAGVPVHLLSNILIDNQGTVAQAMYFYLSSSSNKFNLEEKYVNIYQNNNEPVFYLYENEWRPVPNI